jgi:hypothetical protein
MPVPCYAHGPFRREVRRGVGGRQFEKPDFPVANSRAVRLISIGCQNGAGLC